MQPTIPRRTILRKADMKRRTGNFNDATYHRWEQRGLFPQRIVLGPNCIGWYEDEIDAWAANRVRAAEATDRPPVPPPPRKKVRRRAQVQHAAV